MPYIFVTKRKVRGNSGRILYAKDYGYKAWRIPVKYKKTKKTTSTKKATKPSKAVKKAKKVVDAPKVEKKKNIKTIQNKK